MEFNVFGKSYVIGSKETLIKEDTTPNVETSEDTDKELIREDVVVVDNSKSELLGDSSVVGISESVVHNSPRDIKKMLDSNEIKMSTLLDTLKGVYSDGESFKENEEMAKDTIIGTAMELMADDSCMPMPQHRKIVRVESQDKDLETFLNNFLDKNVRIEDRVWEWAFEIVKHGDFKLRKMEYSTKSKANNVYYENVTEGYKISRIEYLGTVLGYLDGENDNKLEDKDAFVHFMSSKLPNRKKIKLKVKDKQNKLKEVSCFKVSGSSLMDNARYIYRIVNLLDNMLIMSRVARSTQYNIVKIEVGNASPNKTQDIIMDVRRRIEGSTRMSKNSGMKSDPSPIPVNSNVYIPTREGKGDITVESVNESIDVKDIVDIEYFRNKEFASIKTPKAYLGFEEELPGSMGNNSLVKLDIRYARNVQRAQNILRRGLKELCNNYLRFRGRVDDIDKFEIEMKIVTSAEDMSKSEDFMNNLGIFDSMMTLTTEYGKYVSKPKLLTLIMGMLGVDISDIASKEMEAFLKSIRDGEEIDEPEVAEPEGEEEEDFGY